MRTSSPAGDRRPGRRRGQRGFTLLELLAVLAVIALVVAIVLPQLPRQAAAARVRASAEAMANGLRETRGLAIRRNAPVLFTLDLASRRWGVEGGRSGALPENLTLALETDRWLVASPEEGAIRFFADGSSTGGRVELRQDDAAAAVTVDWLTGAVAIDD